MKTKIFKISKANPDMEKIRQCAEIILNGDLVAFPTETVYGLGANALNENAVKKIFKVKGRKYDNPLIVHIANKEDIYRLAKEVPKNAEILIEKFFPGPLTLILKKSKIVPKITTSNLSTIAIRMPSHKVANLLIKESCPISAPSANISGRVSPTTAQHVINDLNGKISTIIDSGKTDIGLESTVIDLTSSPKILRPGKIIYEELKEFLPNLKVHKIAKGIKAKVKAISPGMKYRHYSPKAKMILVEGEKEKVREKIEELINKNKNKKIGVLSISEEKYLEKTEFEKSERSFNVKTKFIGKNLSKVAKNLFSALRDFDNENVELIIAEGCKEEKIGLAILNRLRKGSSSTISV